MRLRVGLRTCRRSREQAHQFQKQKPVVATKSWTLSRSERAYQFQNKNPSLRPRVGLSAGRSEPINSKTGTRRLGREVDSEPPDAVEERAHEFQNQKYFSPGRVCD